MKKVLFVIFCLLPSLLYAQVMKERRVYYLDCSGSMKKDKLNEKVCDNLINAIESVVDETTELMVIPFAFNTDRNAQLNPFSEKATPSGKAKLIADIKGIKWIDETMTYHKDPIEDFYKNSRVLQNGITYMFLMTDGQDEWPDPNRFLNDLRDWKGMYKYDTKNVYGFYVMLDAAAKNADVEKIINQDNDHFWTVNSADVNISLARVPREAVFNKRNEEYLELPITGDCSGYVLQASFEDQNAPYVVTQTNIVDNNLRVKIEPKDGVKIPDETVLNMSISCTNAKAMESSFKFWVSDCVAVTCFDKKERTLKLKVK